MPVVMLRVLGDILLRFSLRQGKRAEHTEQVLVAGLQIFELDGIRNQSA